MDMIQPAAAVPLRRTIGAAKIYLGDSLAIMRQPGFIPADQAGRVHVICDPPYESHMHRAKAKLGRLPGDRDAPLDFDSVEAIRQPFCTLAAALKPRWFIVFATSEGVAPWRDSIEAAGIRYKRACLWIKPDATPQFNGQGPALGHEMIVTAWGAPGVSKWNGGGKRGVWTFPTNNKSRDGRHPTEKPVDLMAALIRDFTAPGDLVVDPFAGSGTTGVAAIQAGRRFIGIEKNRTYFDVMTERLKLALPMPCPTCGRRHDQESGA